LNWQPSADMQAIKARASLYQAVRAFFLARDVLEVDVPLLGVAATVDPFIESLTTHVCGEPHYLQTSPEFFLKRLLAAGSGSIYSLGRAFRDGERGARHRPEFTLLEWYRIGWDEHQLMDELALLVDHVLPDTIVSKVTYRDLFLTHFSLDPHTASIDTLKRCALEAIDISLDDDNPTTWLDLLMAHCIEPHLPKGLVFIYDYPKAQAALAKVSADHSGRLVARRFEAYLNGVELANGYFELTDHKEQLERFRSDSEYRSSHQLPVLPYDRLLVSALEAGMPVCAGVAMGIDRLLMAVHAVAHIDEVMTF